MPHLNHDWYNDQREDMSDDDIAQELDLSFERSAGGRVLNEIKPSTWFTKLARYDPRLPLEVVIDPGFADHLACIWFQPDKVNGQFRVVDFVQTNRRSVDWIVPFIIGQIPENTYRGEPWHHRYNEVEQQIIKRHMGIDPVFGVARLLALIESCNQPRIVGNVEIAIFIAVEYPAATSMNLRTLRHIDMQNRFVVDFDIFDAQIKGWIDLLRIV